MSFTSISFLLFVSGTTLVYYLLPLKFRWTALLAFSCIYYVHSAGWRAMGILVFVAMLIFASAIWIESITDQNALEIKKAQTSEEKKKMRKSASAKKHRIMGVTLVICFGFLAYFKYDDSLGGIMSFCVRSVISAFSDGEHQFEKMLTPLGISFFLFQASSYLIDVCRGNQRTEKNPLKFITFVLFFPQMVQGPISRYKQLAPQLLEGHKLEFENLKRGILLIGFGFIKKLLLADRLNIFVSEAFSNSGTYGGAIMFLASLCYGLQVYCDFFGGMQVTVGVAQMMGIEMVQNFRQPYFAISISDFWRRWHITLGAWMRDYIFYPLSLSRAFNQLGKWARSHFGKRWSKIFVSAITSFIVFTIVGIWHGSELKYVVYGFYNGGLIMLATLFEPIFESFFKKTKINPEGKPWHAFRICRTILLVSLGRCIVRSGGVRLALQSLTRMVVSPQVKQLSLLSKMGWATDTIVIVILMTILLAAMDWIGEYHGGVLDWLERRPLVVRWLIYLSMIAMLVVLSPADDVGGGFIYAKF